jgi:DNA-binding Lrp family transcriptional regulator
VPFTKTHCGVTAADGITIFVEVRLKEQTEEHGRTFERAIAQWPEVVECFLMTGDADYLLRVVAADVKSYQRFLDGSLRKIKGFRATKSSVAMRQVKHETVSGQARRRKRVRLGPGPKGVHDS